MDDQLLNSLLFIVAVLTAVWNIIVWYRQRNETRELTKLTSDLEHKVHRLSVSLDQKVYRLNRVRDLVGELMRVAYGLRQVDRDHQEKLNLAVQREISLPELAALVAVINDKELETAFDDLGKNQTDPIWPSMWNKKEYDFALADKLLMDQNVYTKIIHKRVLELLEETTKAEIND